MRTVIELDTPVKSGRGFIPLWKRLLKYTKVEDGHWLWTGYKMPAGHGQIRINYRLVLMNRLSAHIYHGLDLDDAHSQANHKDECRIAACWNPAHIYVGSQQENMVDKQRFRESRSGANNKLKTSI